MQKLRVVARNSKLSLIQVKEVFDLLETPIDFEIIPVYSYGDKHKEISLLDPNLPQDFFTRELDEYIKDDKADIAIHSAKDLPFPLPDYLELIALTEGKTDKDALVSRNNLTLQDLPVNSKIGLSSKIRKENILSVRRDLQIIPLRGTIEERINYIYEGKVDAIVVALCALERLNLLHLVSEVLPFKTHPLQGKLTVVSKKGKPELKKIFYELDERKRYGKVWMVGAGPGDERLITLKALECIKYADTIYYDDLINYNLLNLNQNAKKIYIGKREKKKEYSQDEINEMLYESAKSGEKVIRLKGGDSLIFARTQEEIIFLLQRFIPVEIIPGISSAQAAAAISNISLTSRYTGSKLSFQSGYISNEAYNPAFGAKVFFMGASSKKQIKEELLNENHKPDEKVLLIRNASLPDEKIEIVELKDLDKNSSGSPLIIIAGDIVKFYFKQNKILYTGTNEFETLVNLQGRIIFYPLIKRIPIIDLPELNKDDYYGLIFTSPFAVECFFNHYGVWNRKKYYVIGKRTKEKVKERCLNDVDIIIPDDDYNSDELFKIIQKEKFHNKLLYPCSDKTNNEILKLNFIKPLPVYYTVFNNQPVIDLNEIDGIYFGSALCFEYFFKIYSYIPEHITLYAGGIKTYQKIISKGYEKRTILLNKINQKVHVNV